MLETEKVLLLERVQGALNTVRPHLKVDGGDVELVDVTDDMRVQIKWMGMCQSCSMSAMTLRAGIYEAIKGRIPEILGVDALN